MEIRKKVFDLSKYQNYKTVNSQIYQYMISIDKFSNGEIEMMIPFLNEERQKKAEKFHYFEDTKRCVLGYILIQYALYKNYGISMPCKWKYNTWGKPILNDFPHIHFNLSHSKKWIIACVSAVEIGVDIEQIQKNVAGLYKYVFRDKELDEVMCMDEYEASNYFFRQWTAKEAYLKYLGKGLNKEMRSVCFDNIISRIYDEGMLVSAKVFQKKIDEQYWYSIVAECSPSELQEMTEVTKKDILTFINTI